MRSLPLFHRIAGKPVLVIGDGDAAEARRRLVAEAGGRVVNAIGSDVRLAFVAVERGAQQISADLRAQGLLVHVADQPDLCDFFLPAILDRAPVTVAISTDGTSASLAKALKERLNLILPTNLGGLAQAIRAARNAVRARYPDIPARRQFWAQALAPGGPLDPLTTHANPASAILTALEGNSSHATDIIEQIDVPKQGAEALTLKQLRLLAAADLVIHPAEMDHEVLALVRRDAARQIGERPPAEARGRVLVLRQDA
ncbi:MAG: NAD(P)-dependent oxidoreductase [Sphingomonadaceae bacterium]